MTTTLDQDRLVPPPLTEEEKEMVRAAERLIMTSLDHSRAATITIQSNDGSCLRMLNFYWQKSERPH